MPGPQSTLFFLLLLGTFGALLWWMMVARHLVFKVLAGCLAFVPAMMFGVAAVNKFYDYYPTWTSAISDLLGQDTATRLPSGDHQDVRQFILRNSRSVWAEYGHTFSLTASDPRIRISRTVNIFLPPQYFQPAYRDYRFPAIELIHGFPGVGQDWITVMGINVILDDLLQQHRAAPVVLVMPNANGARTESLQCLNMLHGPQDATYLAQFLPGYLAQRLRIMPPGSAWGIAGYSEGGFCAANLGLQYGRRFGYAGVMSGYFRPLKNQIGNRDVAPFGHDRALLLRNTPLYMVNRLPAGVPIPQFWLGAGQADRDDVAAASLFQLYLQRRQPDVILDLVPGGGHTMLTWRTLAPPMLEWMTRNLRLAALYDVQHPHKPGSRPARQHRRHQRRRGRRAAAYPVGFQASAR